MRTGVLFDKWASVDHFGLGWPIVKFELGLGKFALISHKWSSV